MMTTPSLKRIGLLVAVGVVGGLLGAVIDRTAMIEKTVLAQQPPAGGIKRTILQRVDVPGSTTHEVVMGIAEVPPGVGAGRHFHHGIEIGYLLEGTVEMEHQGRPTTPAKGGDSFKNDLQAPHDVKNTGTTPARVLAVYVVEKGKPLAEPAK